MIGLIGLILGGYRYFFSALLSVALVISLSGMHLGWHNIIGYPNALKVGDSNKGVVGAEANHMENLRSLLTQLSGTDSGAVHMICWAVFVLAVLSVGYLWAVKYKRVQAHPFAFRAYASLTIVMMLVLSPHTHTQDYVFMSPSCSVVLAVAISSGRIDTESKKHISTRSLTTNLDSLPHQADADDAHTAFCDCCDMFWPVYRAQNLSSTD